MTMRKITPDQAKDTGMAMVLISLLALLVSNYHFFLQAAVALLVVNMTYPKLFTPVAWLWLGLSGAIGNVVSKILLTVLFFTIVTPIGLIRRLAGADTLKLRRWRQDTASAFMERNHKVTARDLERPY